ncbi:2'-5' RNA ligase family protein [Pseudonocardia lacus]|uniref:2'-5' RNA ligase family protein n=1 Tax=Pseudonocardia lacus TaxID=2835865 RepID=UPI001BDD670F|nr:2'-5' RNA ligase family protein [Pseudonocardia lacus]
MTNPPQTAAPRSPGQRCRPAAVRPLIVTAVLAPRLQERFDRLRRRHFPAERNHLAAHVTLFHCLPGQEVDAVASALAAVTDRPAPSADVVAVRFLGRGVAFDLRSPELDAVRAELAGRWDALLVPQDRRPHRPHVTVQNKVAPEIARALHADLAAAFVPETAPVPALELSRYLGGPWEPVSHHPFTGAGRD